jgi:2-methylcitrate dehydratase
MALHLQVKDRIGQIERIEIHTQESGVRIISKDGPLHNPADRDHCIQYMVAVPLLYGRLTANDYEDSVASDPRIDALRERMRVTEDPRYTRDYLDTEKRSIANAIQVFFRDGTSTDKVEVEYPIGHRRRRAEGIPVLEAKFLGALRTRFPKGQAQRIYDLCQDEPRLMATPIHRFMDLFII